MECLCGEKLVLLGREQDCQEEGCTLFRCECGRELTPAEDRADERALAIGEVVETEHKGSSQRLAPLDLAPNGDV